MNVKNHPVRMTSKYQTKPFTCPRTPCAKVTKTQDTSHTKESRGQPFPADDYKAARNRNDLLTRNTNIKRDPSKKHGIGTVSKTFSGRFKQV